MARDADQLDAWRDFPVAFQQPPLTRSFHRQEVVGDVAGAVALGGPLGMLQFAALHDVARIGKRRDELAVHAARIPAAVVEMQVRIDDQVDLLRPNPALGKLLG